MQMKTCFVVTVWAVFLGCSAQGTTITEDDTPDEQTRDKETSIVTEDQKPPPTTTELGQEVITKFYVGDLDPLYARFSNRMMKALSKEQWQAAHDQITQGLGKEVKVLAESEESVSGFRVYRRQVNYEKAPNVSFDVTISFSAGDVIEGFGVFETPVAAESKHLEYKTKTDLRVPWTGKWLVFWGGRTLTKNYHVKASDQRFALDVLAKGSDGKSFNGAGKKNSDYLVFGREVLAPGAGVVISIENAVDDNEPGVMNAKTPLGNHVIIDHQNGEFSFLAHFKKGTVAVKKGDKVKQGQKLGECGNSGNSSEPHIHYHLQNTGEPFKGEGLPIQFRTATVDGENKDDVEIEKGQVVSP